MAKGKVSEWSVKEAVNRVLRAYPESYWFMPVPYGYGKSSLDYLICHYGIFIAIETKAPGEVPTARQKSTIREITGAGGEAFVIDSVDKCHLLRVYLEQVKQNATSTSQSQAQDGGSSIRREHPEYFPVCEANAIWGPEPSPAPASPDGNVPAKKAGVRRAKPDPDALRLVRGKPVQEPEVNKRDANARATRIRPERDGDGED